MAVPKFGADAHVENRDEASYSRGRGVIQKFCRNAMRIFFLNRFYRNKSKGNETYRLELFKAGLIIWKEAWNFFMRSMSKLLIEVV